MAIAGEGTKTNPYLVHNYNELKDACKMGRPYEVNYIRLENDIDCNSKEYPKGFEWEGINLYYGNQLYDLDLNEHAIRNAYIKNGSYLFQGRQINVNASEGITGGYNPSRIRNGKILNVFNNVANNVIKAYGAGSYSGIDTELIEVSMSIDGNGLKSHAFEMTLFNACSVYYKTAKFESKAGFIKNSSVDYDAVNTDFWIESGNPSQSSSQGLFIQNGRSDGKGISGCRFQGGFSAGDVQFNHLINCVVDMDITLSTSGFSLFVNSNGVFNKDKIHSEEPYSGSYMIPVTNEEMRSKDPEVLTEKGFPVVKDV